MVLIYRKSLKLSSAHGGIGNIINLLSNDCNRVAESFVNFHFLWSSALEIIGMRLPLSSLQRRIRVLYVQPKILTNIRIFILRIK